MLYLVILLIFSSAYGTPTNLYSVIKEADGDEITIETLPTFRMEKNGSKYYYFGTIFKGSYFQATQFCNYHGMQLLSIETPEENKFLHEKLKTIVGTKEQSFWTSGTTLCDDDEWVWLSTGERIIYTNWLKGQPNNAKNKENCLEIVYKPSKYASLFWNDNNCAKSLFTICETTLPKTVSTILAHHEKADLTLIDVRSS